MTSLARHIDIRPARRITTGLVVVVFFQISGVAYRTATIPVLEIALPEKRMLGRNIFIGPQMEPALTSLYLTAAVRGNIKRL